jgi:hypothetical protein
MTERKPMNKGSFGKLYRPPLECPESSYNGLSNYVGKITDFPMEEFKDGEKIRAYEDWAGWACPAIAICNTPHDGKQLIFRYCGTPIEDLLVKSGKFKDEMLEYADEPRLNPAGFDILVTHLIEFLPYVLKLNKTYIHNDLHYRNILFDGNRFYMIDFATLKPIDFHIVRETELIRKKLGREKYSEAHIEAFIESHADDIRNEALCIDLERILSPLISMIDSPWGKTHLKKYRFWLGLTRKPKGFKQPLQTPDDYVRVIRMLRDFM